MIGDSQLYLPNIVDSFNQGMATGRADRTRRTLAQYLQPALGGDQGALAQIYHADPGAGVQAQNQAFQQQQQAYNQQQQAYNTQQQDRQTSLQSQQDAGDWARKVVTAAASGDMQTAQQIYAQGAQKAGELLGAGSPPPQLQESMLPHLKTIADTISPLPQAKPEFQKDIPTGQMDANGNPITTAGWAVYGKPFQPLQGPQGTSPGSSAPSLNAAPQGTLAHAVMGQETGGNPNAVSSKGAVGDMQTMPSTLLNPGFGVTPARDNSPAELHRVGVDYLGALSKYYKGDTTSTLAAYNWGPGNWDKQLAANGGDPVAALAASDTPNETKNYVPAVMNRLGRSGGGGSAPTQPLAFGQSSKGANSSGDSFRLATADEIKAAGLPQGTSAQINKKTGKIDVIAKPDANSASIVAPGDSTKTGDEYLATIPESMRPLVKAIARGDQAPPSASSRSPEAQALLQAVYAYDPTASASNLPTRSATRKSFTSGKDAQNMTALSQLALHLDHLNGQVDSIAGYAAPNFVNNAINAVSDKTNGKTTAFESSANAVAHELRSVFANANGGTQAELEENLKQLNSSNSVAQKQAAIKNIAQLVQGRFGILQDKYSQGMGRTEDPFAAQFPGAESTILRLSGVSPAGSAATTKSNNGWSIQLVNQ